MSTRSLSPLISSRNALSTHLIFLSHNNFLSFSFLSQVLLDFAKMEAYLGDRAQAVKLFETTVKRFPTHDRWESGRGSEWIVILEDSVCLQKDVMWSILCVCMLHAMCGVIHADELMTTFMHMLSNDQNSRTPLHILHSFFMSSLSA